MKVVDYHLAASTEERDERVSFFGKDSASGGGWSPQPTAPPSLRKADVEVLAAQLQVTRTELGALPCGVYVRRRALDLLLYALLGVVFVCLAAGRAFSTGLTSCC